MKICTRISAFLIAFLLIMPSLEAQKGEDEEMRPAGPPLGWGVNIGNIRFFNNSFQFGIAPNIAWKLGESTAVGFMMKLDYYYERFPEFRNQKFSAFDLGPTVFVRWKPLWTMESMPPFLQGIFLQAEYERASIARPFLDINQDIFTVREGENYLYLGLGATSGYPFSTFFSIHYNVLDDAASSRIPFNYRLGFTYNY